MKSKIPLIAVIIFGSFVSRAQVQGENDFDRKYTPNQNSIFNNLLKKNTESSGSSDVEIKNSIKFYPTMAAREKIFFSYTADLGKGFCLELGIGKAFGTDYFQSTYFALFNVNDNNASPMSPNQVYLNSKYTSSFPLLSIGAKIYFSGKTFDGGYIDFMYRYERMDYVLNPSVDNYPVIDGNGVTFTMNSGFFGFGYTSVSGEKNNFTHDFFINFGIKAFKYTEYDVVTPAGLNANPVYQKSTSGTVSAKVLPALNMGYAFGFGF